MNEKLYKIRQQQNIDISKIGIVENNKTFNYNYIDFI